MRYRQKLGETAHVNLHKCRAIIEYTAAVKNGGIQPETVACQNTQEKCLYANSCLNVMYIYVFTIQICVENYHSIICVSMTFLRINVLLVQRKRLVRQS